MPISFSGDLDEAATALPHFWEHTVGSGHATLALRADWQSQLKRAHDELGMLHVRFHGILDDDMGTLIEQGGTFIYSFFNADQIMDFLLSIGMKPFVELSFMPTALASSEQIIFHYRANVSSPRDPAQWSELIRRLVTHWVERYGVDEVRQWFFEVWNEPNLTAFGSGQQRDYFELYRYTVEAIKTVDDQLKVGGPATAANAWIDDFLTFCKSENIAADFISDAPLSDGRVRQTRRRYRSAAGSEHAQRVARRSARGAAPSWRLAGLLHRVVHVVQSARSDAR